MTFRSHKLMAGTVMAIAGVLATTGQLPVSAATRGSVVELSTANHVPAPPLQQVALPGMTASAYSVTLPTGDRVRLDNTGSGHYVITAEPAATSDTIEVTAVGGAHAVRTLYAFPSAAAALIRSGRLDPRLFDVRWLAAHGDSGPGGSFPVTMQYTGSRPPALPGATVVTTTKTTQTLRVRAASAARFWAALAGHPGSGPWTASKAMHPQLATGLVRAWPAGERPRTRSASAGPQTFTVTEDITFTRAEIAGQSTLNVGVPMMWGESGAGPLQLYTETGESCLDTACTRIQVTYAVPIGLYIIGDTCATYFADNHMHCLDISIPQIQVGGNTTVSIDADSAMRYTVSTPRPSVAYTSVYAGMRVFPDGQYVGSISSAGYASGTDQWVMPTAGVTIGTYHCTMVWQLGAPPVTMTTGGYGRLPLNVSYPSVNSVDVPFTRFSGSKSMLLADAGYGTSQDFSGQDVRGKLVLIRSDPGTKTIDSTQLDNALQAGAAGVLAVAYPDQYGNSLVPFLPGWVIDQDPTPALPLAEVAASDANGLVALLKQGPVRLLVTDNGSADYQYDLAFTSEGHAATAPHYAVADDQLDQVDTTYQDAQPGKVTLVAAADRPDDPFASGFQSDVGGPLAMHMYYGPIDPELVWLRTPERYTTASSFTSIWAWNVFDQGSSPPETWFDQSEVPGAPTLAQDVFASQPGRINGSSRETWCSFCRFGDLFFPQFDMVSGQSPRLLDGPYQFDPSQTHLYLNGTELPQSSAYGALAYQLVPQRARYRLTTAGGNLDTTWTFSSAHPAHRDVADGFACYASLYNSTDSCAALPLIMLRYNAFADINDAITAGGTHRIQITSYDQATGRPTDITSLKFWTSTDGGTTWQQAQVGQDGDGGFWAVYSVLSLGATNGRLSIRARATDAAGNTIDQTYYNDYALTSG